MFQKVFVLVDFGELGFVQDVFEKVLQLVWDYGVKIYLLIVCFEVQSFVVSQLLEGFQDCEVVEIMVILKKVGVDFMVLEGMVDVKICIGFVYYEVIEEVKEVECDLVIMMFYKFGLLIYFIGFNVVYIVCYVFCLVMVFRG